MKISNEEALRAKQVSPIQGANSAPALAGSSSSTAETPAATVNFSPEAQDFSKTKAAVENAPDVRTDLVNSLKERIDAGTYQVSGDDIAEMMLRRHSADHVG